MRVAILCGYSLDSGSYNVSSFRKEVSVVIGCSKYKSKCRSNFHRVRKLYYNYGWGCCVPYEYFKPYAYGTYYNTRTVRTIRVWYVFLYHTRIYVSHSMKLSTWIGGSTYTYTKGLLLFTRLSKTFEFVIALHNYVYLIGLDTSYSGVTKPRPTRA